ncbi:MAG TPA: alpha/beta fold hydrolase [Candidatus Lokiarchaeia archaeon]|nr:alpha/beta fold hydrolase [Candidatus Lokiarchaeia archaeon]
MDLEAWIWIVALSFVGAIFVALYIKKGIFYFSGMDLDTVLVKHVKIPVGDIELNGKLLFPRFALDENQSPREPLPLIFFNHGWGAYIDQIFMMQYAASIAMGGPYAVLMHDCRGFGKSPGIRKLDAQLFDDVIRVIDFGEKLEGIDPERLGFIGVSMGGQVALARAYPDKRIKAIVAMCTPHDAMENFTRKPESLNARVQFGLVRISGVNAKKVPEETNQKISPRFFLEDSNSELNNRVMLLHDKDDALVHPREFEMNRKILGLGDDRAMIFKHGGHPFLHQELLVLASALRFFKAKL